MNFVKAIKILETQSLARSAITIHGDGRWKKNSPSAVQEDNHVLIEFRRKLPVNTGF